MTRDLLYVGPDFLVERDFLQYFSTHNPDRSRCAPEKKNYDDWHIL